MDAVPNDELVAQAYLRSIPSLADVPVATTLAKYSNWGHNSFINVEVTPLGVPPHPNFPSHNPRVVVHCWAAPKDYGTAADLAQLVRAATYAPDSARTVTLQSGYQSARVMAVSALAEPVRIEGPDPDSLSHYSIPLLFEWI